MNLQRAQNRKIKRIRLISSGKRRIEALKATKYRFVFVLLLFPKHNLNSAQILKADRGTELAFFETWEDATEG